MSEETIIVSFNLAKGVTREQYLTWAQSVDLPTVNGLDSVIDFKVFKGIGLMGHGGLTPKEFYETIEVSDIEKFMQDLETPKMKAVIRDFLQITCDAEFIRTSKI